MRWVRLMWVAVMVPIALAGMALTGVYAYLARSLPEVTSLKEVQLQSPLRIYSAEGDLIAEYGEVRRKPVHIDQVPLLMQQAFIAAEDDRFYAHPGVDYQGLLRAALYTLRTGEKVQGGSTITMQLARNFFLSGERTYERKLREILLAFKIEQALTKAEILELYLNKIYLGNHAYGVGAAAEIYYGKGLAGLGLDEIAMIAGLPKAPSTYNPVADPERALVRRNYVLRRMRELELVDQATYQAAIEAPVAVALHQPTPTVDAPYIGEMVRAQLVAQFGEQAYSRGLVVFTTVKTALQRAAQQTLRDGILSYGQRHGYRGPEDRHALGTNPAEWDAWLSRYPEIGGLRPGLVTTVSGQTAQVYLGGGQAITLDWQGLAWAKPYIDENRTGPKPRSAVDVVKVGDVIRVRQETSGAWQLAQIPEVSGALIAIDPADGALLALTGGFDFRLSPFNRAVQARRQPGSSFKPFIYSAALEQGFTPASIINDAPVIFNDAALEDLWRPENDTGKFYGPTRLREALAKSRNLVSIRLLDRIGIGHTVNHGTKFGFSAPALPHNLSLALGSGVLSPLELAAGYAVFANGGFRVEPYFIDRIEWAGGGVLFKAKPAVVCAPEAGARAPEQTQAVEGSPEAINIRAWEPRCAEQIISADNAYQIVSMLQDVVRYGTAVKAKVLGREDIAGKTGSTNDTRDAWFSGFNGDMVTTVWVGFDEAKSLGQHEVGGVAALPVWIDFMRVALDGKPSHILSQPPGMVTVRIDPRTGLLAGAKAKDAIFETFRLDQVPTRGVLSVPQQSAEAPAQAVEIPEQLF